MIDHFSNELYQQQLHQKTDKLKQLFSEFTLPELRVYESPKSHYRMRAEFRIWHEGDDLYHVMYNGQTKQRIRVSSFPIASQLINQAMKAIVPLLQISEQLRFSLFQIDYLASLTNQLVITLLYHKPLTDAWEVEAKKLKAALVSLGFNIHIVGRAAKQKRVLDADYVDEALLISDKIYTYRQIENSFSQPNASVNIKMLEWAVMATKGLKGDLLEFYCGNGNFSIALAQNFRKVLATEISKTSVRAAQHNIAANHIDNLSIIRLSAEEFTSAINKEREFNRLKGIDLDDYQCDTVLVDPPRSGLDGKTLDILKSYQTIIYISCNPLTLRDNLTELCQTHKVTKMALFDQFPYTEHMETGVLLTKHG